MSKQHESNEAATPVEQTPTTVEQTPAPVEQTPTAQQAPVLIERHGPISLMRLNRPKQLNALNDALMDCLGEALLKADKDPEVMVIIITGSDKAFAAGADIDAMKHYDFVDVYKNEYISRNAMMCDMVFAADNAKFGQPEIKLAVIPGAGGTQRLTRLAGKAKAMDMVLTGKMIGAEQALADGLVSRVYPLADLIPQTLAVANDMAKLSLPSVMAAKESINRALEVSLSEGLLFERRNFHALFGTVDQKEGMQAFLEKRTPAFKQR
ncbi:MAG: enoyl-CoA hydratase [Burkholderiaceae bacterium]|nr:enoyl-CoA hydratase [Burkholderiaceae bacterium]